MPYGETLDSETERFAGVIVDSIFKVHLELGPGLLESIYEECLVLELESRGLRVRRQVEVPIFYLGKRLENPLRLDVLVEECIIIEVKSVVALNPVFFNATRSYLTLSKKRLGFLVNFNVVLIKDGIKRVIV